jgi:CRISPR-associated endoribonuclease Cas6
MTDLLSLVLTLRPLQIPEPERPLPTWWGQAAYTLFLRSVGGVDAALAEGLHADSGLHPFTVSSLMGRFPQHRLSKEETYRIRFTTVRSDLAAVLERLVEDRGALGTGQIVELDYLPFRIDGTALCPQQQPWAGRGSYQELAAQYLLRPTAPDGQITFQFTSPTTFRSNGRDLPLPLPELVFSSLLERWNLFAPLAFPPEVRRFASDCLEIRRYRLRARTISLKDERLRTGMSGEVTFRTHNYDRYWMSLIHTLAEYAQYAGVGAGTALGLGQARRLTALQKPGAGDEHPEP